MIQFKIKKDDVEAVMQDWPINWKFDIPYSKLLESDVEKSTAEGQKLEGKKTKKKKKDAQNEAT